MVNNDLQERLGKKLTQVVNEIVEACPSSGDVFDMLCDKIECWAEILGYSAYIRVFWHDDGDDFADTLDDILDVTNRFNINAYCNIPNDDYRATFTVMLYKEIRDE